MALSERQKIFLRMAKGFALPCGSIERRALIGDALGLCTAEKQNGDSLLSSTLGMDFEMFEPDDVSAWWWPRDQQGDFQRSIFCCFMAALTDKDWNEMTEV